MLVLAHVVLNGMVSTTSTVADEEKLGEKFPVKHGVHGT